MQSVFTGPVYVVRDNIDTDQIIPAQYLNLIPTLPEEYEKLGSHALCGLPDSLYPDRFVQPDKLDSEYPVVVVGAFARIEFAGGDAIAKENAGESFGQHDSTAGGA